MLHTVLHLERPLVVFDTETTGTNPQRDRIVEFAFQLYTVDGLQKSWRSLINPGIPIPPKVSALHGIDDARMGRCRVCDNIPVACTCPEGFRQVPAFRAMAPSIAKGFVDCDFAGKNIRFDLRLLDAEMARAEVKWSYAGARIVDADRLEQLADPRTLAALYRKHLGGELSGAHGAMADVEGVVEVIHAQLTNYTESLPRELDALHHLQWPDWITAEGQFRFEDGVPTCCFGNKYRGEPVHKIPRDYWDWILRNDFAEDVRQLARDAKLGKYPEKDMVEA